MWVKICGMTNEEDALFAAAMGADAVGFVFAPSSRQVTVSVVRDIVRRLPSELLTVGVFRDQSPRQVVEYVHGAGLHAAQLHGHETVADARWVHEHVQLLICAFPAGDTALENADEYGADIILLDSHSPGSGQLFDWSLAEFAPPNHRILLAGGLTPDNVADAVKIANPWGVDVSTGVESAPGRKDPMKVKAFIRNARGWGAAGRSSLAKPTKGDDVPEGRVPGRLPFDWQDDGDL